MSVMLYIRAMAFEEKRAWIMAVVSVVGYGAYVVIVLGGAGPTPLAEAPYAATLLWCVGMAIVVGIVANIVAAVTGPKGGDRVDQRDKEIGRIGEHIGQSFVVLGGVAALLMALLELDHFWIANVIYLGFVLSAILGSVAKIFAYRRGFQTW